MKPFFVIPIAIFAILGAQAAQAKITSENPADPLSCESSMTTPAQRIAKRRTEILAAALDFNARVPQLSLVIVLAAVVEFLNDPIPLQSLIAPLTKRELEVIVERFNRIHEAYGIPIATEGFKTNRPIRRWIQVSDVEALENHILLSTFISVTKGIANLQLNREEFEDYRGMRRDDLMNQPERAAILTDKFFTDPKYSASVRQYKLVGTKISEYLRSADFNHSATEFKILIAKMVKEQLKIDPSTPVQTENLALEMEELIKHGLKPHVESVPGVHPFFFTEFFHHASGG